MNNKTVFLYAISALLVIALAGVYPRLAMVFVGLLILGVIVEHGADYAAMLNALQGGK